PAFRPSFLVRLVYEMAVVVGDHQRLERAQQKQAQDDRCGNPQGEVNQGMGMEGDLRQCRRSNDDEADNEDDEDRGPLGAFGEREVESAAFAARANLQETAIE